MSTMKSIFIIATMALLSFCSCHTQKIKINDRGRWGLDTITYDSIVYKRGLSYAIVYKDSLCALYNRKERIFITEFLYKSMDLGQKRITIDDGVVYDFNYKTTENLSGSIVVKFSDNSIIDGWMTPVFSPFE